MLDLPLFSKITPYMSQFLMIVLEALTQLAVLATIPCKLKSITTESKICPDDMLSNLMPVV